MVGCVCLIDGVDVVATTVPREDVHHRAPAAGHDGGGGLRPHVRGNTTFEVRVSDPAWCSKLQAQAREAGQSDEEDRCDHRCGVWKLLMRLYGTRYASQVFATLVEETQRPRLLEKRGLTTFMLEFCAGGARSALGSGFRATRPVTLSS